MAIIVNLDVMMAKRKMSVTELANKVDITMANLSILKNNKAKAVRFTTLDAICRVLECQPGDILEYVEDDGNG
ncbi:transcriptional regulator [Lachnoclostridium sp. An169]|uniref:helix-turn-helix domain-containing protein n=1 Tax=Lachnoclostridium sp. An169 TaxID=1965569 RepID=UPI000B399EE7|nr:helix-turn-helix transcriptional regulator [Lachnoclostridium sp. An169]OUP82006.1 transcriptional regulator [Lachnoclostridium sp. An169]HJA65663.1 helix-turn-helix transcriptional regulator [Candidatus Mediterraneibacter cottocaccae]